MRIWMEGVAAADDEMIAAVRRVLDAAAARRASMLADQVVSLLPAASPRPGGMETLEDFCRASAAMEGLLLEGSRKMPLGSFVDRMLSLRGTTASPASIRVSVGEVDVEFDVARAVWFLLSDLLEAAECMHGEGELEVLVAIEPEPRCLFTAFAVGGRDEAPVSTLSGSRALARVMRLASSLGGGFARGTRDGMMIFGVTLPVRHD